MISGGKMFKGKKVLITGSDGMIGKELVELMKMQGAEIRLADLRKGNDLRNFRECLDLCDGVDYVFHLAGIKGNPRMTKESPIDFMGPMLQFDTNMILAGHIRGVKRFLYTSSIAVQNPKTDFYPAWAKKTGENLIKGLRVQNSKTRYCIVRPANVYGRFDDFSKKELMLISDLIRKAEYSKLHNLPLEVWGDGSQERDIIHARDVAEAMIKTMEIMPEKPIRACTGKGMSVSFIANLIADYFNVKIVYDKSKPTGDKRRVMKSNMGLIKFKPKIKLVDGIKEVIEWKENH
jgi:GDP-L-fucose synthase